MNEESRWRRLLAYLGALWGHWVAFVTSGFLAAVASQAVNAFGVDIPNWLYAAAFIWGGALVAGFLA